MAGRGQKRQDVWRNRERHYCSYCNAWMGSDRQSILIHENGKKHKENVEASLKQKRLNSVEEEKKSKALAGMLQKMEQAAATAHEQDVAFGTFTAPAPSHDTVLRNSITVDHQQKEKDAKESWEARKRKREEENKKKRDAKSKSSDDTFSEPSSTAIKKRKIGPDEGHYTIGNTTYLEGPTFGSLLEEDMPVQLWTGFEDANLAETRLSEKQHLWKNGIVVRTRKSPRDGEEFLADVSYLLLATDTEETLEKSVKPGRIRIVLGADDSIPDTLEEARLLAMGGEVTEVEQAAVEVDENTGLSSWGTVSIKRTTVHQELKDERARLRAKSREEAEREQKLKKEADARRMEQAKVENAEDSALGAYDVWSSGKGGYKGVDIHKEVKLGVQDTAKSLSKGMGNVGFKKRSGGSMFKKSKKKNIRKTSADDDDDD